MLKSIVSMRNCFIMPHITFLGGKNVVMRDIDKEIRHFVYAPNEDVPFIIDVAGITPPTEKYYISRNCGDHYILAYIPRGYGTLEYNGIHYDLRPHDAFLLEPGSRHFYHTLPEDPFELIWANFFCDYMDSYLSGIGLKGTPVVHDVDCEQQMLEIVRLTADFPNNDNICFSVLKLVDQVLISLAEKTRMQAHKEKPSLAYAIKSLLDEFLHRKPDINEVAEKLHISKSTLYREFTRTYGMGAHQYVLMRKIDFAKSLLVRTDLPVKDIADRLAFSDEFYFSNIFKQKTGKSPSSFRRALKPNKFSPPPDES